MAPKHECGDRIPFIDWYKFWSCFDVLLQLPLVQNILRPSFLCLIRSLCLCLVLIHLWKTCC